MSFFDSINGFLGQANGVLSQVDDALDTFGEIKGRVTAGSTSVILPTGGGFTGAGLGGVSPWYGGLSSASPSAAGASSVSTSTLVLLAGVVVVLVLMATAK